MNYGRILYLISLMGISVHEISLIASEKAQDDTVSIEPVQFMSKDTIANFVMDQIKNKDWKDKRGVGVINRIEQLLNDYNSVQTIEDKISAAATFSKYTHNGLWAGKGFTGADAAQFTKNMAEIRTMCLKKMLRDAQRQNTQDDRVSELVAGLEDVINSVDKPQGKVIVTRTGYVEVPAVSKPMTKEKPIEENKPKTKAGGFISIVENGLKNIEKGIKGIFTHIGRGAVVPTADQDSYNTESVEIKGIYNAAEKTGSEARMVANLKAYITSKPLFSSTSNNPNTRYDVGVEWHVTPHYMAMTDFLNDRVAKKYPRVWMQVTSALEESVGQRIQQSPKAERFDMLKLANTYMKQSMDKGIKSYGLLDKCRGFINVISKITFFAPKKSITNTIKDMIQLEKEAIQDENGLGGLSSEDQLNHMKDFFQQVGNELAKKTEQSFTLENLKTIHSTLLDLLKTIDNPAITEDIMYKEVFSRISSNLVQRLMSAYPERSPIGTGKTGPLEPTVGIKGNPIDPIFVTVDDPVSLIPTGDDPDKVLPKPGIGDLPTIIEEPDHEDPDHYNYDEHHIHSSGDGRNHGGGGFDVGAER